MIVNPVTVQPPDIAVGDVMIVTVTVHILEGRKGKPVARTYRCIHPYSEVDGVPQGSRIATGLEGSVIRALFPVVRWADIEPDSDG